MEKNVLGTKMISKEGFKTNCDKNCQSLDKFQIKHLTFIFKKVYLEKMQIF